MSTTWPSGRSGRLRSGGTWSRIAHIITIYFKCNIRYLHYRRTSYWRLQNITYEFLHINFIWFLHLILFYSFIPCNCLISRLKLSTACLTVTCAIHRSYGTASHYCSSSLGHDSFFRRYESSFYFCFHFYFCCCSCPIHCFCFCSFYWRWTLLCSIAFCTMP